jgi:sarcosine oxidase/sarcosine oxidase subunit beta
MHKGKVLVVGAGIAGLSTAWGLVRRGFEVEVFDQGPIPNPKATSHDEHRITRHAYGEMHRYARLMPDCFRLYEQLWADIGACHLTPLPSIVLEREPTPWIEASIVDLEAMGVPRDSLPTWDDLQILPAQLHRPPLLDEHPVGTDVVIGPNAKRPLRLAIPLLVSDMSFGALSASAKVALAGACLVRPPRKLGPDRPQRTRRL